MTLKLSATALLLCTGLMAGCAGSPIGSTVQTASVDPNAPKMASAKPDPTCVALLAKIDGIRKDGVTERAEQAAVGKSTTVPVKRASLGQLAELSKANAEYQSKCSAPGLKSAYVAPAVAPAEAAAPTAEKTEKSEKSGTKAATKPVAAAKPAETKAVAAAVTAPSAAPAAAPVVPPVVQAAAPAVVAPTVATPAVAVPNPASAAVTAAKQAATQAATAAAAQVTPMPSIPGVSVAGQ